MNFDLSKYSLEKYLNKGKDTIYDNVRGKYIVFTPEEDVRQRIICFFIYELKVPRQRIDVEVHLSHFEKGHKRRADIIVFSDDDKKKPLIVVECKASHIPINTDDIEEQILAYDEVFKSPFIMLTNGEELNVYHLDKTSDKFQLLDKNKIPSYRQMLKKINIEYDLKVTSSWQRPAFNVNYSDEVIGDFSEFGIIGEESDKTIKNFAVNLGGLFFDETLRCPDLVIDKLGKLTDEGNRIARVSNASGIVGAEEFRRLILQDIRLDTHFFNLGIQSRFTSKGYFTYLVLSVDKGAKTNNTLQLCLDKYSFEKDSSRVIWHDGQISFGNGGSFKSDFVITEVKKMFPELVQNSLGKEVVMLGKLPFTKELNWEDENVKYFLANVLKYGIVREQIRNNRKKGISN